MLSFKTKIKQIFRTNITHASTQKRACISSLEDDRKPFIHRKWCGRRDLTRTVAPILLFLIHLSQRHDLLQFQSNYQLYFQLSQPFHIKHYNHRGRLQF